MTPDQLHQDLTKIRSLRENLKAIRLYSRVVRKREILKRKLIKAKWECMEMEFAPLLIFLRGLLDQLQACDTGEIFMEPVDQSKLPNYGDFVKYPMDLSTMRHKVNTYEYEDLDGFEKDFHLMINNCLAYNAEDTVFYRAAIKMREQGYNLFKIAQKQLNRGIHAIEKIKDTFKKVRYPFNPTAGGEADSDTNFKSISKIGNKEGLLHQELMKIQSLRQNLKAIRLYGRVVRKREILKKKLIKAKWECKEMEFAPLIIFLRGLVDQLQACDTGEIFMEPVDQSQLPNYGDFVKYPMDLSTMRHKVNTYEYEDLDGFEKDFYLMINNCLAYNAEDTVFYRAATKMREQGNNLFKIAQKQLNRDIYTIREIKDTKIFFKKVRNPFHPTAGGEADSDTNFKSISKIGNKEFQAEDVSMRKSLDHKGMNNGVATLRKSTGEKHSKDVDSSEEKVPKKKSKTISNEGPVSKRITNESSIPTESVFKSPVVTPLTQSPRSNAPMNASLSGVSRRTTVLFTRKAAAAKLFRKPDMPASPVASSSTSTGMESGNVGTQAKRILPSVCITTESLKNVIKCTKLMFTNSFHINQSKGEITDEDLHLDNKPSCSSASAAEGSSGNGSGSERRAHEEWVNASTDKETVQKKFKNLKLVWAKGLGYPWYPALVMKTIMPNGERRGVPILSPTADALALFQKYTEPVYLLLFFDSKRTWQWLPCSKLQPLGLNFELDRIKLIEARNLKDGKAIIKAYEKARTQHHRGLQWLNLMTGENSLI